MNTYKTLTNSEDAKALKEQYKRGCVCAYEVALALVSTCDFESNPDIVSFDDLFESLQTWVKSETKVANLPKVGGFFSLVKKVTP